MTRTALVTGAASGIGKATAAVLADRGYTVIGADIAGAEVTADLTTVAGRTELVTQVERRCGGALDAVLAIAGLAHPTAATVAVNFFGMVATLDGLRPLLTASGSPRAVGVSSMAALFPVDNALVAAMAAGDEDGALRRAHDLEGTDGAQLIYSSSKRAFSQWIRREAATDAWAGAGIPLNAVAPGIIATPMTADLIATEEARHALLQMVPMPLNGIAEPDVVANLLAWLVSEENSHLCGQVVYVDGGSDVVIRGDTVY